MSTISKLSKVLRLFEGSQISDEERDDLFREALLMTLARASSADANVSPIEVESVCGIMKEVTGEDVSAADVRVAAKSEIYERASLDHYLARVGKRLTPAQRSQIAHLLGEVIKSDVRVTSREIEFFDKVAHALKATPSEIAGLTET